MTTTTTTIISHTTTASGRRTLTLVATANGAEVLARKARSQVLISNTRFDTLAAAETFAADMTKAW